MILHKQRYLYAVIIFISLSQSNITWCMLRKALREIERSEWEKKQKKLSKKSDTLEVNPEKLIITMFKVYDQNHNIIRTAIKYPNKKAPMIIVSSPMATENIPNSTMESIISKFR